MTCVNPIEVFFTGSSFFFLSTKSPCGNLDYLTGHCLQGLMSSSWKLSEKSLTVIIVLRGRLERRKEFVDRFDLHYIDTMALNDDEKGLSIEFFGFYLLDDLLGIRKCRVCLFRRNYS